MRDDFNDRKTIGRSFSSVGIVSSRLPRYSSMITFEYYDEQCEQLVLALWRINNGHTDA